MQKRSIIIILSSIVMLLLSAVTFVFAWFTIVEKTQEIFIYSGRVELDYQLKQLAPLNSDLEDVVITSVITYDKLIPGDSFDYILTITNMSTIPANLTIDVETSGSNDDIKEAFIFEFGVNSNHSDSSETNFMGGISLYDDALSVSATLTIYIRVTFNRDYERPEPEINNQYVKIDKIKITLVQTED